MQESISIYRGLLEYYAPPVKRTYLEKEDGSKRLIGMPVFESKVVERAVVMLLEAVYEQDFYDCSYGFRPGRSPHQALTVIRNQCAWENIQVVVASEAGI